MIYTFKFGCSMLDLYRVVGELLTYQTDSFHGVQRTCVYLRYFLWNRWQRSDKSLQFFQNGRIKGNQIHEAV